jgi:hypothetical protein
MATGAVNSLTHFGVNLFLRTVILVESLRSLTVSWVVRGREKQNGFVSLVKLSPHQQPQSIPEPSLLPTLLAHWLVGGGNC